MTDKYFGQLSRAGSLTGDELFAVENGDGNSRAILASRARNYMQALAMAALTTHEADITTHGISEFVSTITPAASASAFLELLGIYSDTANTLVLPGGILVQWGIKAIGTGGSVVSGTLTLPTAMASSTFTIVATPDGAGNAGRNQLAITIKSASTTTATYEADTGDSSWAIDVARNFNWIAIGTVPA